MFCFLNVSNLCPTLDSSFFTDMNMNPLTRTRQVQDPPVHLTSKYLCDDLVNKSIIRVELPIASCSEAVEISLYLTGQVKGCQGADRRTSPLTTDNTCSTVCPALSRCRHPNINDLLHCLCI